MKDRGCEWLYPLSRLVKRGKYDADGKEQQLYKDEQVYFYQEDAQGLLSKADPDLQPVGDKPVPWR